MRYLRSAGLITALMVMAGCMQMDILVKVRPDGTGTIDSRVTISKARFESMGDMGEMASAFTEEGARDGANDYGPGVTFISAERIDDGEMIGIEAHYEFQNAGVISIAPMNEGPGQEDTGERVRFTFAPEDGGKLTISLPQEEEPDGAGMMKAMMAGLKVRMAVEVEGGIARANTRNVDGNVLTIMEIDFDEIASDDDNFKEYLKTQDNLSKARGIKGVTYPENNPITVEFGDSGGGLGTTTLLLIGGGVALLLLFFLTSVRVRSV